MDRFCAIGHHSGIIYDYNYFDNQLTFKKKNFFHRLQPFVEFTARPIHNNWDLMDYRRQLRVGDTVDLTLLRNGEEIHCQVTLTATK